MVMPCSRSASRPSSSRAKSMPLVGRAEAPRILLQSGDLVLEQAGSIVDQPADQGRLAVVDRAAGEEAQLAARSSEAGRPASEVALALLALHGGLQRDVDQPALAFGRPRRGDLGDDAGDVGRARTRWRRSAASSPACGSGRGASRGFSVGLKPHALVVDHDQRAAALDHLALGREIERHDRESLSAWM